MYAAAARVLGMHAHGNYVKRISVYRRMLCLVGYVRQGLGLVTLKAHTKRATSDSAAASVPCQKFRGIAGGKIILPFRNNPCDPVGENLASQSSFGKASRFALI